MTNTFYRILPIIIAAFLLTTTPTKANEVAQFYKGKTMTLLLSTGVGGGNDLNARTLMNHMVKHIPGKPNYKAINMPGAGHVRATNYLYNKAPKDGSFIGAFIRYFILHQALGGRGVRYNASEFTYLGSTSTSNVTFTAFKNAKNINKFEDLLSRELIVGGTGVGSGTVLFPTIFNALLGTKIKIVQGYKSGNNIDLAMERGEVNGRAGNTFDSIVAIHPTWIKDGTLKILAQVGLRKEPGYENIPMVTQFAKNADDRSVLNLYAGIVAVGSPIITNQGVPNARVHALVNAFNATMKDPAYLADAKKKRLSISPTNSKDLTKIVNNIHNAPSSVLKKAKTAGLRRGLIKCKTFTSAKFCKSKKKRKKKKK